ncbi:serine/threonine protein kinase [Minicystis rosea]|nr:serine/threonine protein kinase [Minicystis rosea]
MVRAIGEGGMGVVYLARDERLARDVALKLGSKVANAPLERLVGEARALAKLAHPNVVVVHEVGEVDGRLFVAMEHVDGGTARAWVNAEERGWRAIVELYCAAGDGLAAAHAAGLSHRDFKPDNVLVGADGRPRVADFGLARSLEIEPGESDGPAGTQAYMAPEQKAGGKPDARDDQFSFCVSLWEALYGARPFDAGSRATKAPRHIERALRRGLSPARDDRWPSVSALLAELRRDPGARLRRTAIVLVALAAVAAVAIGLSRRATSAVCADSPAALASIWGPARSDEIARAFSAAGGDVAWSSLQPRVQRYADAWTHEHAAACKATRVDGSQSEALLDQRMLCLTHARAGLAVLLDELAAGDRATLDRAADRLALLPDIGACGDLTALGKQTPLPTDRAVRSEIERVMGELLAAAASVDRGDAREPVATANRLVGEAKATGWLPLIAEAMRVRASLQRSSGDRRAARVTWEEAAALELKAGDDDGATLAMLELARDYASGGSPVDAKHWIELARAIWSRRGEEPRVGAKILEVDGLIALAEGRFADDLAILQRMVELMKKAHGDDAIEMARTHFALSHGLFTNERYEDAAREAEIALQQIAAALGDEHPQTARYAANLAQDEVRLGKLDAGLAHARRALTIDERWFGPNHAVLNEPLQLVGMISAQRGDAAEARRSYERALSILRAHGDRRDMGELEVNMAVMEFQLGDMKKALAYAEEGASIQSALLGEDNEQLLTAYTILGGVHRALGRLEESEKDLRHAIRVVELGSGPENPGIVNPAIELSYTLVLQRRAADAVALLAPMVALCEKHPEIAPPISAEAHMAYADALWVAGRDRTVARKHATTARDGYAAIGEDYATQRKQADEWLNKHRAAGVSSAP